MQYQADIPYWKAEFKEKKMNKARGDEIPQWKRDLQKRLQSKNQRMDEERLQADVLEHIPKVSNNIFLVQEKQNCSISSAAIPKTVTAEKTSTQPRLLTLAVDNVIIIEKETQNPVDEVKPSCDIRSGCESHKEDQEYPMAGIVQRLMGKFQEFQFARPKKMNATSQADKQPKTVPHDKLIHHTERNEFKETVKHSIIPPPAPQSTPAEEDPPLVPLSFVSPYSCTMSVDLFAPVLRSSAKPFSKQFMTDAADHGYQHVSIPTRKVSAPTPTNTPVSQMKDSIAHTAETLIDHASKDDLTSSKTSQRFERNTIGSATLPKPEKGPQSMTSFSEDLSNLHSNHECLVPVKVKETVVLQKESSETPTSNEQIDLQNGDTLHASGNNAVQDFEKVISEINKTERLFQQIDESGSPLGHIKSVYEAAEKLNLGMKEVLVIPRAKKEEKGEREFRTKLLFEGSSASYPNSRFNQVARQSLDESMLNSQTAGAANRMMPTSKTVNPSGSNTETSEAVSNSWQVAARTIRPGLQQPGPARGLNLIQGESRITEVKVAHKNGAHWNSEKQAENRKLASKDALLSTSIDDLLYGFESNSVNNSAEYSLPWSIVGGNLGSNIKADSMCVPLATAQSQQETVFSKAQNSSIGSAGLDTVSITAKSECNRKMIPFGGKTTAPSCGKSFVIDPSKFRKSSSRQSGAPNTSTSVQESGNTRMVVPRSIDETETDSTGEKLKPGKRKLRADQIIVIGGYVSLKKSCLARDSKTKKDVSLSFSDEDLETTYTYISERSLLQENSIVDLKISTNSPGFGKDGTIGKYTPKFLLSMKAAEILDEDEEIAMSKTSTDCKYSIKATTLNDATAWSDTTSSCTDILF